ncbi:MAG: hypothetical protein P1V97_35605, partial [Planctomycetota bacterium]|nr:hypothetical protein [Planctomycetota bacterium]
MATIALSEYYSLTGDESVKARVVKAVAFCLSAQNPGAGWKYGVRPGNNDSSMTGWMTMALKAALAAGIEIPNEAFYGSKQWFKRATSAEGKTGYQSAGGGSSYIPVQKGRYDEVPTNTAVSLLVRLTLGELRSKCREQASIVSSETPLWLATSTKKVNLYYWYYGTYALLKYGGKKWTAWNAAIKRALLPQQHSETGCAGGSWDPVGEWCIAGGRVYSTAMSTIILEAYYRGGAEHRKAKVGKVVAPKKKRKILSELERKLKSRVSVWLAARDRLRCTSCTGKQIVKCSRCGGSG